MFDHFLLGREFFEVLTAHDEAIAVRVAAEGCLDDALAVHRARVCDCRMSANSDDISI
jgi:hypothetical protein